MNQTSAITIRNERSTPHMLWIEPCGEDYTMLSEDELVVRTTESGAQEGPSLFLVETKGNTQLYVERGGYPTIFINGAPVACGHNRQAAIDANIRPS